MKHTSTLQPLRIAVLTVSDTRTLQDDASGDYLVQALQESGHHLAARAIEPDDKYRLRATASQWIADSGIQVIIITGGSGFTPRDVTPEAITPLIDKHITGFGEMFRSISAAEIGSSTLQSRACAGLANQTLIFCLPGSPHACRTAWQQILVTQLDSRHQPCNFSSLLFP